MKKSQALPHDTNHLFLCLQMQEVSEEIGSLQQSWEQSSEQLYFTHLEDTHIDLGF